ncbi:MAG: hypothetical protein NTV86_16215, partial [Planctomycetota bacterium]|nr:hypothetical protein [Planctomycetota bacterium]
MTTPRRKYTMNVLCVALAAVLCASTARAGDVKLMPSPKSLKVVGGDMPLTAQSRIVATDPKLKPLAV